MSLYAIGDLHLSSSVDKPMDIFGDKWKNHDEKIKNNWEATVKEDDVVLVLGDVSWGTKMKDAQSDFDMIHELPGQKFFIKGNHDYWWTTATKLNKMYDDMKFIQTGFFTYKDYAICGGRGWICPNEFKFTEEDKKIYDREAIRIEISLKEAKKDGYEKIIVITHYPPTNDSLEDSVFTDLYEKYRVEKVYYGHLHGEESFKTGLKGIRNGIEYNLVSADYIDFMPIKVMD